MTVPVKFYLVSFTAWPSFGLGIAAITSNNWIWYSGGTYEGLFIGFPPGDDGSDRQTHFDVGKLEIKQAALLPGDNFRK